LVRDYLFTGLGLGNFGRPYPVYALLTYYFVTPRTRNVIVDLLIEQGALGLLSATAAFAIALVAGMRGLRDVPRQATLIEAGLASMIVILINGVVNNPLQGSNGSALGGVLLLLPMAIVVAAARAPTRQVEPERRPLWVLMVLSVPVTVVLAATVAWRPIAAAVYANLGAVEQTRVELGIHDPLDGDSPSLDDARRSGDLSLALDHFNTALWLDGANPTAGQRLAQIALSRGEYASALAHAQATWDAGHRDEITRLTLGDAYVAAGRVAEAAGVVRDIGRANRRFAGQGWYRYMIDKDYERATYAYAAAVAVDPADEESAQRRTEAERSAQSRQ
jgi:hypothetical protein